MLPLHLLGTGRAGEGREAGERAPYLEIAQRWKDDMTHRFMSKELTLPAYSISDFLPRFKFKKNVVLIYFVCSIIQQDTTALHRVGGHSKGRGWGWEWGMCTLAI